MFVILISRIKKFEETRDLFSWNPLRETIKYYNIIEAIDDRVDIDMQKSPYLKAYTKNGLLVKFVLMILRLNKFTETHGVFSWNLGRNW